MLKFSSILEANSKKSNILYLHGLNATKDSENINLLANNKINLIFKELDYTDPNLLESLLTDKSNIDAIIGHSLGAFLGYHISNIKNIPSLLFNPSFNDNDVDISIPNKYSNTKLNNNQIVVIGLNDDESLPEVQIKNLKESNCKIYIENIGHDIPNDIKLMYYNIFLAELFKNKPYSEYKSTFIHNGNEYSINKLFDITKDTKIEKTKIELLSWILEYDTTDDTNRDNYIDLNIPIIVTVSNNKYVVLDGVHRLKKAIVENNEYILTKYINEKNLENCII